MLLQRGGGGVVHGIVDVNKLALGWHLWALARALNGGSGWPHSGSGVRKEVDVVVLAT